jgi:hypothetical protein
MGENRRASEGRRADDSDVVRASRRRFPRRWGWLLAAAFCLVSSGARSSRAEDPGAASGSELTSPDFRVRASAAVALGRMRVVSARGALEHALSDSHPAVRAAAAEALGSIGDDAAIPALTQRLASEPAAAVRAQIVSSIDLLRAAGQSDVAAALAGDVHYVIALGSMRNSTGIRAEELRTVLSAATRDRARTLRGAAVAERDAPLVRRAAARHIPVLVLDGNVTQVLESRGSDGVQIRATVEFTVRRDQTLKGTLSGRATSFGSASGISDEARRQLQDDAVSGAVQSALRGVEQGLIVAAR